MDTPIPCTSYRFELLELTEDWEIQSKNCKDANLIARRCHLFKLKEESFAKHHFIWIFLFWENIKVILILANIKVILLAKHHSICIFEENIKLAFLILRLDTIFGGGVIHPTVQCVTPKKDTLGMTLFVTFSFDIGYTYDILAWRKYGPTKYGFMAVSLRGFTFGIHLVYRTVPYLSFGQEKAII